MKNSTWRDRALSTRPLPAIAMLALALLLTILVACDNNPTDPNATPLILSGNLTYQGSADHNFSVPKDGTVRIEVDELRAVLVDVTFNPDFMPFIGLAIGRPTSEGCAATARFSSAVGSLLLFQLLAGNYCLQVTDPGALPVDGILFYAIAVRTPD